MNREKSQYQHAEHEFGPVYDRNSKALILGSFPSVKSREQQFYYGHPQNRFWKMLSAVCSAPLPVTIPEKRTLLLEHHIALWDVIASCDIIGSSDSSIKNVMINDICQITENAEIRMICCNGDKSYRLFTKYMAERVPEIPVYKLPSTSPANAACSLEKLIQEWEQILYKVIASDQEVV